MQLLRQALDKLQSETRVLDDELAHAREQAIFGDLERAELSHELEQVTAQLQASEASKAELEGTISKVLLHSDPCLRNLLFAWAPPASQAVTVVRRLPIISATYSVLSIHLVGCATCAQTCTMLSFCKALSV